MKYFISPIFLALILSGCNSPKPADTAKDKQAAPKFALTELWRTDSIFLTCESVLFDAGRQQLYVSCIQGAPGEKDGKGFIALLNPDGQVMSLGWVTGLDAPKGMGIHGNDLYVADIDQIVTIDIETAAIKERTSVEGASFLNDISVDKNGKVYFSDSNTGFIWTFSNGKAEPWITAGLDRPNGLFVEEEWVLLTSSGSQDLKIINISTGTFETVTTEIGHGDGIEFTGTEGHYLTSSWAGEVFLILPDFSRLSLLKTSEQGINSADIGFNIREQVVYVPTFFDNRVVAYKLTK
jgi:outer membrane protein assembly factor BamB